MKFKEYVKMGCGVYIEWSAAKSIDTALRRVFYKTGIGKRVVARTNKLHNTKHSEKETVVMGFHM